MSRIVLRAENISKQYRLGQLGTGSIAHDLNRFWARARGKEDPYLKVGDVNDRSVAGGSEYVWSLKDINFEVKQGEVLGIIGKNGAGKSTLLKILSQVTSPTTGDVKIKGRIAALLEVGTGFHPELSGRENIFLNGAILGMTKQEIRSKLDEIIDFSGVAKYLDTPVKRYSSGMTVRLGFAIAAHLEPEILIVDEVLAVGDAEFQKKCLGKMKDVSGQGRTILFVSHNMQAVQALCSRAMVLANGETVYSGTVPDAINKYYDLSIKNQKRLLWDKGYFNNDIVHLDYARILSSEELNYTTDSQLEVEIACRVEKDNVNLLMDICLYNQEGLLIFDVVSKPRDFDSGKYIFKCVIPKHFLNSGNYSVNLLVIQNHNSILYTINEILNFEIEAGEAEINYYGTWSGVVKPRFDWEIEKGFK